MNIPLPKLYSCSFLEDTLCKNYKRMMPTKKRIASSGSWFFYLTNINFINNAFFLMSIDKNGMVTCHFYQDFSEGFFIT
jgi:hypothetical protein